MHMHSLNYSYSNSYIIAHVFSMLSHICYCLSKYVMSHWSEKRSIVVSYVY